MRKNIVNKIFQINPLPLQSRGKTADVIHPLGDAELHRCNVLYLENRRRSNTGTHRPKFQKRKTTKLFL